MQDLAKLRDKIQRRAERREIYTKLAKFFFHISAAGLIFCVFLIYVTQLARDFQTSLNVMALTGGAFLSTLIFGGLQSHFGMLAIADRQRLDQLRNLYRPKGTVPL
ncbi:hypothetical protein [Xanthomonas phage RTH11]|nr:hypothetical protein [Xanthomonas phage RTH11]